MRINHILTKDSDGSRQFKNVQHYPAVRPMAVDSPNVSAAPEGYSYLPEYKESDLTINTATHVYDSGSNGSQYGYARKLTEGELTAAAAAAAIQTAFDAAGRVFEAMTPGKQALWQSTRIAVGKKIQEGDMAGAKEVIETVPALYEGMEDDRAAFLALF